MIDIDGKLCWSPHHPFEYGVKLPSGIYFSHMALAINRAFNLNEPPHTRAGIHHWNLAWLVTPLADTLPDMVKNVGSDLFSVHSVPGARTPQEFGEIAAFADYCESDLNLSPTKFVTQMKSYGYKELFGMSIEAMMLRATASETSGATATALIQAAQSNVVYVQFGKRRA